MYFYLITYTRKLTVLRLRLSDSNFRIIECTNLFLEFRFERIKRYILDMPGLTNAIGFDFMFAAILWLLTVDSKNLNDICRPSPNRLSKKEGYLQRNWTDQIVFYKHVKLDQLTFHSYSSVDDEPTLSSPPPDPFQVL